MKYYEDSFKYIKPNIDYNFNIPKWIFNKEGIKRYNNEIKRIKEVKEKIRKNLKNSVWDNIIKREKEKEKEKIKEDNKEGYLSIKAREEEEKHLKKIEELRKRNKFNEDKGKINNYSPVRKTRTKYNKNKIKFNHQEFSQFFNMVKDEGTTGHFFENTLEGFKIGDFQQIKREDFKEIIEKASHIHYTKSIITNKEYFRRAKKGRGLNAYIISFISPYLKRLRKGDKITALKEIRLNNVKKYSENQIRSFFNPKKHEKILSWKKRLIPFKGNKFYGENYSEKIPEAKEVFNNVKLLRTNELLEEIKKKNYHHDIFHRKPTVYKKDKKKQEELQYRKEREKWLKYFSKYYPEYFEE